MNNGEWRKVYAEDAAVVDGRGTHFGSVGGLALKSFSGSSLSRFGSDASSLAAFVLLPGAFSIEEGTNVQEYLAKVFGGVGFLRGGALSGEKKKSEAGRAYQATFDIARASLDVGKQANEGETGLGLASLGIRLVLVFLVVVELGVRAGSLGAFVHVLCDVLHNLGILGSNVHLLLGDGSGERLVNRMSRDREDENVCRTRFGRLAPMVWQTTKAVPGVAFGGRSSRGSLRSLRPCMRSLRRRLGSSPRAIRTLGACMDALAPLMVDGAMVGVDGDGEGRAVGAGLALNNCERDESVGKYVSGKRDSGAGSSGTSIGESLSLFIYGQDGFRRGRRILKMGERRAAQEISIAATRTWFLTKHPGTRVRWPSS